VSFAAGDGPALRRAAPGRRKPLRADVPPDTTAGETLVWNQLHLMGASGVPGEPDHKYVFKGQLAIRSSSSSTGFSLSKGIYSTSRTSTATFWVEGVGRWDASRSEATESLTFQGDVQGNLRSVLKCNGDPWLGKQPCAVIATYYNGIDGSDS
jgi:hypothetical protein